MKRTISIGRIILTIILIFIVMICATIVYAIYKENCLLSYKERFQIKEWINNENLEQFEFEGINTISDKNIEINLNFVYKCDYNKCLNEALNFSNKFLNMLKEKNLSVKDKKVTFVIRHKNDSSYGEIELSNMYKGQEEFNFDRIRYVKISERITDLLVLDSIKKDVQYLQLTSLHNLVKPHWETFEKLQELNIYNCTDLTGASLMSNEDIRFLKETIPDINISIDGEKY